MALSLPKKLVWTPVLNLLLLVGLPIVSLGGVHQPTHLGPHTRLVLGLCTPTWETSLSGPTDEWLVLVVYTSSSHLLLHRRHSSQTKLKPTFLQICVKSIVYPFTNFHFWKNCTIVCFKRPLVVLKRYLDSIAMLNSFPLFQVRILDQTLVL